MRRLVSFVCVVSLAANANAQIDRSTSKVGTTAAQFLKIGAGARAIALGGAFAALADDINAIYWNPSGLARIGGRGEATFNHAAWLVDTDYDFAAVSLNLANWGAVGLHVISFRVPEDLVRTYRFPEGTGQRFDASSFAMGVSYARNLTDRFSIGFTGKYIHERLWNETANAVALDFGTLYTTPFKELKVGAVISNFGTRMRLEGRDIFFNEDPLLEPGTVDQVPAQYRLEKYEIPLYLRLGLAVDVIRNGPVRVTAAADATHPNDNTEYVNSGVELSLNDILLLRGGYKSLFLRNSEQSFTFGAGLRYNAVGTHLKIDYGYADYGRLENVQFVSLSLQF